MIVPTLQRGNVDSTAPAVRYTRDAGASRIAFPRRSVGTIKNVSDGVANPVTLRAIAPYKCHIIAPYRVYFLSNTKKLSRLLTILYFLNELSAAMPAAIPPEAKAIETAEIAASTPNTDTATG